MQGEFIDLLGFDEISTIELFIANRDEIVESFEIAQTALDDNAQKIKSAQENLEILGNETEIIIGKNKKRKGEANEMQKLQIQNNKILQYLGFETGSFFQNSEKNEQNDFIGGDQIIKEDNIDKT